MILKYKEKEKLRQESSDFYTIKESYLVQTTKAFQRVSLKIVTKAKKHYYNNNIS